MSFLRDIQRAAYLLSRAAGDVNAAEKGTLGKRLVRRQLNRKIGQVENQVFRKW
jgi:hypothetical protein